MDAGTPVFGAGSIHRVPLRRDRWSLLRQALDIGFRAFDVAPAYGNGLNELELGRVLAEYRYEVRVTTKFGIPVDLYGARFPNLSFVLRVIHRLSNGRYGEEYHRRVFNREEMVRSLEGSLRRLRRDHVDDFMIHEPLGLLADDVVAELHEMAGRLKDQGKILRWGVAGPAPSVKQFVDDPIIDTVQCPLGDISKIDIAPPKRRIAYNVYRSYQASRSYPEMSFGTYVNDWIKTGGVDLIVSTKRPGTLAGFKELF